MHAFGGAVMSTELEVSIEEKKRCIGKDYNYFFNHFIIDKAKLYLNTKGVFHTFQAVTSERNTC